MDLGGLWRGDFTLRKAAALAHHLPAGSQVWVVTSHDNAWTTAEYLTALAVDRQRTDSKQKPVPRPSDAREARVKLEAAWAKADRALARQTQQ